MQQAVGSFPQLLSYPIDRLEAHVQYLFQTVGVSEDKLGKVRYCLGNPAGTRILHSLVAYVVI